LIEILTTLSGVVLVITFAIMGSFLFMMYDILYL
jgi:hypothetical protein